jgi:TM2 domain-containing membrane protein YozV
MSSPAELSGYDPRDHPPHLRATDADREVVSGMVRRALDDGRLQLSELDDRLGAVFEAKTHGELVAVVADIVAFRPQPAPRPATPAPEPRTSDKAILPAFLLCFFLGIFGAHRFYAGQTRTAVMMLVLTLIAVGAPVTAIWFLVDLMVLGIGRFRDGDGNIIRRWIP